MKKIEYTDASHGGGLIQMLKEDIMNYISENSRMNYYDMKAVETYLNKAQLAAEEHQNNLFSQ